MRQFALRDLQSAWDDAYRSLAAIEVMAATLFEESDGTWMDILMVKAHAIHALEKLGTLPKDMLERIAQELMLKAEMEGHADTSSE